MLSPWRKRPRALFRNLVHHSGYPVDIGEHHIVDAARRWAVRLSDGSLVFVDDDDIVSID